MISMLLDDFFQPKRRSMETIEHTQRMPIGFSRRETGRQERGELKFEALKNNRRQIHGHMAV